MPWDVQSQLSDPSGSARPRKIAVIGGGISGLSCAWLLGQRHSVTIFEANGYAGGHSNTVEVDGPGGPVAVDTGFIVYNEVNYPNLVALFDHLHVPTAGSDMSFGVSVAEGALEYAGTDLNGLFAQRRNIVRPRFWRMIADIVRFYREAPALLGDPAAESITLGDYLDANRYSKTFIDDHLLPMAAAIWSAPVDEMRRHPAQAFVRFCASHGLLKISDRPQWRTVRGGSREYVRRLLAGFDHEMRLGDPVVAVERPGSGAIVRTRSGRADRFDAVVLATHADQALELLVDADGREHDVLDAFPYQENQAVLHSDPALMPRRRAVWSSWNFLKSSNSGEQDTVCVSYWMNRLQPLDTAIPLFVTLNPDRPIAADSVHRTFQYHHPVFDHRSPAAQRNIWTLQGLRDTWFCGSYFGAGFHEDGLQSGLAVAELLGGVRRPWAVPDESGRIALPAASALADAA
jgi:predicted NAD/FAD-binding protein